MPVCSLMSDHRHKVECIKHDCAQYIQLIGKDPQTGKDLNEFGCAFAFLPMMMIEVAQEVRQVAAATESFRNEMVMLNQPSNGRLLEEKTPSF